MATTGAKYATKWLARDSIWSDEKYLTDSNHSNYAYQGAARNERDFYIAGFDFSSLPSNVIITGYTLTFRGCGTSTLASRKCTLSYHLFADAVGSDFGKTYGNVTGYTTVGTQHYFVKEVAGFTTATTYTYNSSESDANEIQWMNQHISDLQSGNFGVRLLCRNARAYYVTIDLTYSVPATISTGVTPFGSGSVSGGGSYASGSTAILTATPSTGYHFVQWQDGNTSNPRTITVTGDETYTATFVLNSYVVSTAVAPSGSGSVSGGGTYNHGSTATLTATPSTGYRFVKWNDENTSNPRSVIVTGSATYTATFALKSYTISTVVSPVGSGTVSGAGTYSHGSTATLVAHPATGYEFVSWNDGNTSASRSVSVTETATYTATFRLKTYTIYLKDDDGNSLGSVTAQHGYSPQITTTPTKASSGGYTYTFREWNTQRDGSGTSYPLNGLPAATASTTYFAQFDAVADEPNITSISLIPNPASSGQGVVITVTFST